MSSSTGRRTARWFAAGMIGVCALTATACGSDSTSSSGGTTTTVRFLGHTGLQASMDQVIKDFEAAHPNIDIEAEYSPAGPTYGQTLITQIQGGNAPDVFYGNGGTGATESLIPLAKSGKLLDLSDQSWVSNIPDQAKDLYQVDGKTYGLLMDEAPHGILYKPSTFASLGLEAPETFSDVLDICQKAQAQGLSAISLAGANSGISAEILAASLVFGTNPDWNQQRTDNQTTFAGTAGWNDTLDRFKQMKDANCFQAGAETASTQQSFEPMTSGKALMTIVPSGALGSVANGHPEDWAMVPFPADSVADTRVVVGYQDGLAVSADTEVKDAALQFLNYVATDGAKTRAQLSGTVTLADAKAGTFSQSLQGFKTFYENGQTISRPHDSWPGGSALNALNTAVVAGMTGQQSVADALGTVDQAWGK